MEPYVAANPNAFAQGYNIAATLNQQQDAEQQKQQQAQQQAQLAAATNDLMSKIQNGTVTQQDYEKISMLDPAHAQMYEKFGAQHSDATKQNVIGEMTQVYSALQNGRPDIAKDVLQKKMDALKNSGAPQSQIQAVQTQLNNIDVSPQFVQANIGMTLQSMSPDSLKYMDEQRKQQMQPGELAKQQNDIKQQAAQLGLTKAQTNEAILRGKNLDTEGQKSLLELQALKNNPVPGAKPLPPQAMKQVSDSLEKIGISAGIASDLNSIKTQIENGTLKLGPTENLSSQAKNFMGLSDKNSRAYASFKTTLEKMRNDSLRLNNGVQTEGDAQRAWKELFTNLNDPKLVAQRIDEISRINQRAIDLHKNIVNDVRANSGLQKMDFSKYEYQPPAVGANAQQPSVPADIAALLDKYGGK